MPLARADLEALLRHRQLDRTLTTALPLAPCTDEYAVASTGVTALDARLGGGFPRGQLSEIAGAPSSGRASLVLQMLAAATSRDELVAIVDVLDMFDVASAEAAGVDFRRLLWIRGGVASHAGLSLERNPRALVQALNALTLVLQAGNFGLVVFDAALAPRQALAQLPLTTWLRVARLIEGSQTTAILVGDAPLARSAGGLTVNLRHARAGGARLSRTLFLGLDLELDVVRSRATVQAAATRWTTDACHG